MAEAMKARGVRAQAGGTEGCGLPSVCRFSGRVYVLLLTTGSSLQPPSSFLKINPMNLETPNPNTD